MTIAPKLTASFIGIANTKIAAVYNTIQIELLFHFILI